MCSLRVIGYSNGRRITVEEGPARARPAGYGGMALGYLTGVTFQPKAVKPVDPSEFVIQDGVRRTRRICGVPLRLTGEPCHRLPGHGQREHRSRYAMDNAAMRRRSNRPNGGFR